VLACLWLAAPSFAAPPTWDANAQGQFITSLCRDTTGHVWIGTEDQGVWRCDPAAPAGQQYTHYTTKDGLGDDNAYALTCDKAGRVWVGTLNHGVSVFNGKAWRTYGPVDGPLGSRVFALAVSPKDGGVWGATEAGLFRYQNSRWTYFTREGGLPSDQAQALAFGADGTLYVGTQCDGIAVGSPDNNYKTWRVTPGPNSLPNAASGRGLPSALINCLLVTSDNTVFAGTTTGLAKSRDGGETWTFVRGLDWTAKLAGLYHPIAPAPSTYTGDLLTEDYVTSLAEDERGRLFVGHRQTGVEAFEAKTGKRLQSGASGAKTDSYVDCLLLSGRSAWVGQYGGGLLPPADLLAESETSPAPSPVASMPAPAAPPTLSELNTMVAKAKSLKGEMPVGGGAYWGEDWQTQGDWVGRYGRKLAILCAARAPFNHDIQMEASYSVHETIGPHHNLDDGIRNWCTLNQTDNPKSLYDPIPGHRRQSEWDDHGEDYPRPFNGPDIWIAVTVPEGVKLISLYFTNKDGHDLDNRYRDYKIELKPYQASLKLADTSPALAQARVRDFWGGIYKTFMVSGPSKYWIKISKNNSINTIISAVLIDKLNGPVSKKDNLALGWMGGVHYDPPDPDAPVVSNAHLLDELLAGKRSNIKTSLETNSLVRQDKRSNPSITISTKLWSTLNTICNKQDNVVLQKPYRLLAYRSATVFDAPETLQANWRWFLKIWYPLDRANFNEVMAKAHEELINTNPSMKGANF